MIKESLMKFLGSVWKNDARQEKRRGLDWGEHIEASTPLPTTYPTNTTILLLYN